MSITKGTGTKGEPILKGSASNVIIGNYCSIANSAIFDCGFQHHYENVSQYDWRQMGFETKFHSKTKGDIVLGNDVWIGENAIIMSGVTIGDGAVVGANSVVTKNIEPYMIVGGVPAKPIKFRFSQETIDSLLEIRWWDWPIEKIKDNFELLNSKCIGEFIGSVIKQIKQQG